VLWLKFQAAALHSTSRKTLAYLVQMTPCEGQPTTGTMQGFSQQHYPSHLACLASLGAGQAIPQTWTTTKSPGHSILAAMSFSESLILLLTKTLCSRCMGKWVPKKHSLNPSSRTMLVPRNAYRAGSWGCSGGSNMQFVGFPCQVTWNATRAWT